MLVFAAACLGQTSPAAAVFNDFSPTVKGVTFGASHCYIWAHLPGAWPTEAVCYTNGVIGKLEVAAAGQALIGSYPIPSGSFGWIVKATGEAQIAFVGPGSWQFNWTF